MAALDRWRRRLERLLETIVIVLLVSLAAVVVIAVIYRKAGASLSWYDEIASIQLAWLTYYGAALAALKRAHIGFSGLIDALPPLARLPLVIVAELLVIAFFAVMAWSGMVVHEALEGDYLVSLTWVPVQLTKSVIPIGAALFIAAQVLSLPMMLRRAASRRADLS